jgi:hypothetical protein
MKEGKVCQVCSGDGRMGEKEVGSQACSRDGRVGEVEEGSGDEVVRQGLD